MLLALPLGLRYAVSIMKSFKMELFAMIVVFLVGSLFCSAFFAVFLPKYTKNKEDFKTLYSLELLGSLLAMLLIAVIGNWTITVYCFWIFVVCVVHLSINRKGITTVYSLLALAAMLSYSSVDVMAAKKYYQVYWGPRKS